MPREFALLQIDDGGFLVVQRGGPALLLVVAAAAEAPAAAEPSAEVLIEHVEGIPARARRENDVGVSKGV